MKAVRATAKEEAARYSSGDYAGAWDLWTKAGQAAISRPDYVKLSETCASGGIPLEVSGTRLDDQSTAVTRIGLGGFSNSYTLKYEAGRWRWQPRPDDMATYKLGVTKAIAKRKADGSCNGD